MQKLRSNSSLAKLTEEQRADLYDWCIDLGYAEAIQKAAQPGPEGFGLKFHKTTLIRFVRDESKRRNLQDLAERAAQADACPGSSSFNLHNSSLASLISAARTDFAHAVYELAQAAAEPENFDRLERALHHIDIVALKREQIEIKKQELALARERLALDRENFEYNAARVVMQRFAELQEVDQREDIDQDDKIKLARGICFGQAAQNISPGIVPAAPGAVPFAQSEAHPSSFIPQPLQPDTLGHVKTQSAPVVAGGIAGASPSANSSLNLHPSSLGSGHDKTRSRENTVAGLANLDAGSPANSSETAHNSPSAMPPAGPVGI